MSRKIFSSCTIPEVLEGYLKKMEIEIVSSPEEGQIVIVDHSHDIKNYEGKEIISLVPPDDWKEFIASEGRLFLDLNLIDTSVGESILNRFFKEEGSSIFEENYKGWTKDDSFNVSNFFNAGEYLDQMTIKAAESGASAFEVRSALGHIFTALSFLDEEKAIGLPLEVSFGHQEGNFAIHIHGNGKISRNSLESLLSSRLSRRISSNAFFAALHACDLLEVTSLESSDKFTITLNWFEELALENPTLVLNIAPYAIETEIIEEELEPLLIKEDELIVDFFIAKEESDEKEEDEVRIEGVTEVFKDEATLIEDNSELENFVTLVKGKFEDLGEKVTVIKGGKVDIDEVVHRIAGNVGEVISDNKLDIRPIGKKIESKIRSELNQFSRIMNVPAEDLTMEEIARFQTQKMPEIIRQELRSPLSKGGTELDDLKDQVKNLKAELKTLREARKTVDKIHVKAQTKETEEDKASMKEVIHTIKEKGSLSDKEIENIRQNIEKEMEKRVRRIEIESEKKEAMFVRELQKEKHKSRIKEVVIDKARESFTRILNKKEEKLAVLKQKADQLTSAGALNSAGNLTTKLKEVERLNVNLQKQVEFYKGQTAQLVTNLNVAKNDSTQSEELRQLKVINQKLKGMYNSLKTENENLKKENRKELTSSKASPENNGEVELKRFRSLNQQLEGQLKEASQKIVSLEAKMVELSRLNRMNNDDSSKVRIGQLEASVKKLTQDTIEAKNQVNESKKEVNRLRQERTFLQNQLDRMKKEAEKNKKNAQKKAS